eukprot:4184840-Ditylum_brightwellii.AAC.1
MEYIHGPIGPGPYKGERCRKVLESPVQGREQGPPALSLGSWRGVQHVVGQWAVLVLLLWCIPPW